MNKQQAHLEQMIALTLLAYVVGLFLGEALRDVSYGHVAPSEISYAALFVPPPQKQVSAKWKHYSGLFVLLKQKLRISKKMAAQLQSPVSQALLCLIRGNVRSFV